MTVFKKLLSMLIYYKHNVHMLHWKTSGPLFQENHEFLGGLYGEMENQIDTVAELGLQAGENPVGLDEALAVLNGDEHEYVGVNPASNYNADDTFKAVLTMFTEIMGEIEGICKNNTLSEAQRNDLANLSSWYSLRANYLIPRRFAS